MHLIPTILLAILACANVDGRNANRIVRREAKQLTVSEFKKQYEELKTSLGSLPEDSPAQKIVEKLDKTVADLKDEKKPGAGTIAAKHLEAAGKVVASVKDNLDNFKSGDAFMISKAVVDIVGAVGAFVPPPAGTIISSVMGMVSNIMGMFAPQGQQKSMADIVGEVIRKELKNHYKDQLQGKVNGAREHIKQAQIFINTYLGEKLEHFDQNFLITQVNIFKHMPLAGEIQLFIEALMVSPKEEDATNAVALIESYVILTSMSELLMFSMQSVIENHSNLSAKAIGNVIEGYRTSLKDHLMFLRNPKIENGPVIIAYDPAKHAMVENRMNSLGIPNNTRLDDGNCYSMTNMYIKNPIAEDPKNPNSYLSGLGIYKTKLKFSKSNGYWQIKRNGSPVCSIPDNQKPEDSESIRFASYGCEKRSKSRSDFEITKFSDGDYYILFTRGQKNRVPIWMRMWQEHAKWPVDKPAQGTPQHGWSHMRFSLSAEYVRNEWVKGNNAEYLWEIKKIDCEKDVLVSG